jgi:hypothetical protein
LVWGLKGWMNSRLNVLERVILIASSIFVPFHIFLDNLQSVIVGLALIGIFYLVQRRRMRRL